MGHSWSRQDRILRLAKLRGDRAAVAIIEAKPSDISNDRRIRAVLSGWTEAELRAAWGDR